MVQRVFRTAPSIQTAGYRSVNKTFDSLAAEHGLSNMRNAYGESQRKADYGAHKRLQTATEMIVGNGKALSGQDASQFFKPMGALAGTNTGGGGALQRDNGQMVVNTGSGPMTLNMPRAHTVGSFDGRQLGVPQVDA
jgi:hypothetical protein